MTEQQVWPWSSYKMDGRPIITLEDYTITAFGRDNEIDEFLKDSSRYAKNFTRMLLKLVAYWGAGKSTFLYNICYHVNERFFFGDELESPSEGRFTHVLAFFQETPAKRSRLFERVYERGLPVTWGPKRNKSEAEALRMSQRYQCLRKLGFLTLRKAVSEIIRRGLSDDATGGAASRKEVLQMLIEMGKLPTGEFIKKIDGAVASNPQILDESGELIRYLLKMLTPSFEMRKGNVRIVDQNLIEQQFPRLLYPESSSQFLSSYNSLFHNPDKNLRVFQAFEKILRLTDTFLVLVFDEVEDWSQVVRGKIDYDIHDLVVDAESPISLVLVFRTEVLKKVSSSTALGTFMTIYDRLGDLAMGQMSFEAIKKLTAGVLSTSRGGQESTFPCSDEFIKDLADKTKRSGIFNPRTYLSALIEILESSRHLPRDSPLLGPQVLKEERIQQIIDSTLRIENTRANRVHVPERLED